MALCVCLRVLWLCLQACAVCSFPDIMQARCQNESILFTHFGTFLQNKMQVAASSRKTQKETKIVLLAN